MNKRQFRNLAKGDKFKPMRLMTHVATVKREETIDGVKSIWVDGNHHIDENSWEVEFMVRVR